MNNYRAICAGLLLALFSVHAEATPFNTLSMDVGVCDPNNPANCVKPDASGNMPVTGTFSATLGGFTPSASGARGTPVSVTTSDSSGTLPTGAVVAVTNVGTNPMYCNVNGIAATTSDQYISSSGGWFAFTIPAAITTLHCIATGGTTTANTVGGAGLPTGTGGGGGSGGGGAVTLASGAVASGAYSAGAYAAGAVVAGAFVDGWDITQGAKADAAWVSGSGSVIALLKNIAGGVAGSIPAGSALIGDVNVRQGGTALSATNPSFARLTDGTNAQVTDPCQAVAKINFTGSQTTGTQIIAGTSAKKTYICSIQLIAQAAEIVNIIAGTGSVCATGSSAVMGSTTAANGMSYVANGGFTQGSGVATVIAATAANADNVCITQSGSSRITYQLTYVQL